MSWSSDEPPPKRQCLSSKSISSQPRPSVVEDVLLKIADAAVIKQLNVSSDFNFLSTADGEPMAWYQKNEDNSENPINVRMYISEVCLAGTTGRCFLIPDNSGYPEGTFLVPTQHNQITPISVYFRWEDQAQKAFYGDLVPCRSVAGSHSSQLELGELRSRRRSTQGTAVLETSDISSPDIDIKACATAEDSIQSNYQENVEWSATTPAYSTIQGPQIQGELLSPSSSLLIRTFTAFRFLHKGERFGNVLLHWCCDSTSFFEYVHKNFRVALTDWPDLPVQLRCIINNRVAIIVEQSNQRSFEELMHCISVDECWGKKHSERCYVRVELVEDLLDYASGVLDTAGSVRT